MERKAEITCLGRCDGMGDLDPSGSYVKLVRTTRCATEHIIISEGAAAQLADELVGVLRKQINASK